MTAVFHIVAAVVVAFHVLAGGFVTIVILNLTVDEFDPLVIVLKALAVGVYVGGIVAGVMVWQRHRWLVVFLPLLTLGGPLALILTGNALTDWYIPIGY